MTFVIEKLGPLKRKSYYTENEMDPYRIRNIQIEYKKGSLEN